MPSLGTFSAAVLAATSLTLLPDAHADVSARLVAGSAVRQVSEPGHSVTEFQAVRDPINGQRLAVGAIDLDKPGSHAGCMAYLSGDGGQTWRPSNPFSALPAGDRVLSADPMLTFDHRGRLHMICLMLSDESGNPSVLRTAYIRSDDFGRSWSSPTYVPTISPDSSPDKPAIFVAKGGRIVVCALQRVDDGASGPFGRTTTGVALSNDDGRGWRVFEPRSLRGYAAECLALSRDGDGTLHMAFESLGGSKAAAGSLGSIASRDGGVTWGAPVIYAKNTYMVDPPEATAFPLASMSDADPNRPVVYAAGTRATADRRWQLVLSRSTDGGRTYRPLTAPKPPSDTCRIHMRNPVVHVDSRGRLALEFNCRNRLKVDEGIREFWLTVSVDSGDTWLPPVLLSREPEPKCSTPYIVGLVNQVDPCWRFPDGADYWFITSRPAGLQAFWIDNTTGTTTIRTQLFKVQQ